MRKTGIWELSHLGRFEKHLIFGMTAILIFLALFAKLCEDLLSHELGTFDSVAGRWVRHFSSDWLTRIAIVITYLGSVTTEIALILGVGAYLLFRLNQVWETVILAISLAGGWVLNVALKVLFHRPRPDIHHLVEAEGYSFPSGHAMVATAFYGMLGYLLWLNLRKRLNRSRYVIVFTALLILSIGISRVYLGVHYPSDVIAGFAAGGVCLVACIIGLSAIQYCNSNKRIDS